MANEKADISFEYYKEAAAWMLLLKNVFPSAFIAIERVLTRSEMKPFEKFETALMGACSVLDSNMYTFHKDEADKHMFYGPLDPNKYDSATAKEVREMAKVFAESLFVGG